VNESPTKATRHTPTGLLGETSRQRIPAEFVAMWIRAPSLGETDR
jgi:hypothetical protein